MKNTDTILASVGANIRDAVEAYLAKGDTAVREYVKGQLSVLPQLLDHARSCSCVVDAATTPADYVQVGEFVARGTSREFPNVVMALDLGHNAQVGYGYSTERTEVVPYGTGLAATEVVRAMSGKPSGLVDGRRYRMLLMAWEQADEKREE